MQPLPLRPPLHTGGGGAQGGGGRQAEGVPGEGRRQSEEPAEAAGEDAETELCQDAPG